MEMILKAIANELSECKFIVYKYYMLGGIECIKVQKTNESTPIVILIESNDVIIINYYTYVDVFKRKISLSNPYLIDKIKQIIEVRSRLN